MSSIGLWLVCAGVPLLFGLWAQMRVKRTFARYAQVAPRSGMTGAEAAAAVLRASGLPNLTIRPVSGRLTDHYDPRNRTLNLSEDVMHASSLAARRRRRPRGRARDPGRARLQADEDPPDARPGRHVRPVAVDPAGVRRPDPRADRAHHDRPRAVRRRGAVPARDAARRVRRVQAGARRPAGAGDARGRRDGRRPRRAERGGADLRRRLRRVARPARLLLPHLEATRLRATRAIPATTTAAPAARARVTGSRRIR